MSEPDVRPGRPVKKRSGEAQAALGRRAPTMDHRLEPRGGTVNTRRDLLSEADLPRSLTCVCGDPVEEHGHDPEYPGSTACTACEDCIAYEADR